MEMELGAKDSDVSLGPADAPFLFILEARNSFERSVLLKRVHSVAKRNDLSEAQYECVFYNSDDHSEFAQTLDGRPGETVLVPMRLVWRIPNFDSRKPIKLRRFVFGDPRNPGPVRARLMLMKNSDRAELLQAVPATISELTDQFGSKYPKQISAGEARFADFVIRRAVIALDVAERKVQGARYKLPRYVAESLGMDPDFRQALSELSETSGEPLEAVRTRAGKYMKELVARPSPLFVDLRARVDQSILSNAYEGQICYHEGDADALRDVMQNYPTLLLFTHKTYIDGSTPSNMLFEHDLPTAHTFAGQNVDFFGVGNMMRKMGIIFLRRDFKDNPLYKIVLRHYLGYLLSKRFPMSWSFEGTRSRIGKLMPPRYGLLKYVLDSAHDMDIEGIRIVPVVTSFDFIRDVEEYSREEAGGRKKPESLGWFMKFMKSMREPMGRIYADLGEPVIVKNAPSPDDKLELSKIAFNVAVNANNATPITLTSLMCYFLLLSAPRGMTGSELQLVFPKTLQWALDRNLRLAGNLDDVSDQRVGKILDLLIERGVIERYEDSRERIYVVNPDKHSQASYYRNTIIHHFLPTATIELALLKAIDAPSESSEQVFWDEVFWLRNLFKFEFFYSSKEDYRLEIQAELERSNNNWKTLLKGTKSQRKKLLRSFDPVTPHGVFGQFTEAYMTVFDILARLKPGDTISKTDCISRAFEEGRRSYLLRRIRSGASISKTLYSNAFKFAENLELTQETTPETMIERDRILKELRALLVRMNIARLQAISDMELASMQQDKD